jgi:hypothetical protein
MTASLQLQRELLGLFPDKSGRRLYERIVEVLRGRHSGRRSKDAYLHWIRRLILFHDRRTEAPHDSSATDVGTHSPRTFCPSGMTCSRRWNCLPQRRSQDDDLHPRFEPRRARRPQPVDVRAHGPVSDRRKYPITWFEA